MHISWRLDGWSWFVSGAASSSPFAPGIVLPFLPPLSLLLLSTLPHLVIILHIIAVVVPIFAIAMIVVDVSQSATHLTSCFLWDVHRRLRCRTLSLLLTFFSVLSSLLLFSRKHIWTLVVRGSHIFICMLFCAKLERFLKYVFLPFNF